jgi:hypothetical protein
VHKGGDRDLEIVVDRELDLTYPQDASLFANLYRRHEKEMRVLLAG